MKLAYLVLLLSGAVATDIRKHKIYNLWVLPGLAGGLTANLLSAGVQGLGQGLASAALAFFILFPVYLVGGIGAGDVKLFVAAATCLSIEEVFVCIFLSFLIAAVWSLIRIIRTRSLHQTITFAVPILLSVVFIYGGMR